MSKFDKETLCGVLFRCLETAGEDCFTQCGKALVALNLHYKQEEPNNNHILRKCLEQGSMGSHLCEVVLHLLNDEGFGQHYDPQAAGNSLKVFENLLFTVDTSNCV